MRSFARRSRGWFALLAASISLFVGCAEWLPLVGEGWPPGYISGTIPPEYQGATSPFDLADDRAIAAGKPIFEGYCAPCHGTEGNGVGPLMPNLDFQPPAYFDPPVKRALENNLDYVYWWISEGVEQTEMPAFKDMLSSTERWQVIAYIRYLSQRRPAPTPTSQSMRPPWVPTIAAGQP